MFAKRARVLELDLGIRPATGVPYPFVLSSEHRTFLTFLCAPETASPEEPERRAVFEFTHCHLHRFGYPNDEALPGHPLFGSGLSYYSVYEVLESPWYRELQAQNEVKFPGYVLPARRHFAVTLHDSTFECLAESVRVTISTEPMSVMLPNLARSLADDA